MHNMVYVGMAMHCIPFLWRFFLVIFNLQMLVSGDSCSGPWSIRPLMSGGYGCVRFVRAAYTARKCLLCGHHLAMTSRRKAEAKLICIKDEHFQRGTAATTTVSDIMASQYITNKPTQITTETNADLTEERSVFNTTLSIPFSAEEMTTTVSDVSDVSDENIKTTHGKPSSNILPNPTADPKIREMEFLKKTKLNPDLIEVTDKEKLSKSMVCCNPSMEK